MNDNIVQFKFNEPQAKLITVMANETYLFAGRGSGKTKGGISPFIIKMTEVMPRSTGGFVGLTFTQIKQKFLKPLFDAFKDFGFELGVHYTYGKKPPDSWEKPDSIVVDWTNVVAFPNGTVMMFISMHDMGSANSLSLQWLIIDEAKFHKEKRLTDEVYPILRGGTKAMKESPWYGAKLLVTDKNSPNIHWLLAKRKLVDHSRVNAILFYQLKINELSLQLASASESKVKKLMTTIRKLEKICNEMRRDLVYVVEASAMANYENLGQAFFDNLKRSLTDYEYRVAILNEDPTKVENGFYPDRDERHVYNISNDDDQTKPLGVVFDYQASISPLVAFQVNELVKGYNTLNFIDAMYVKHPQGLENVIDNFCEKYAHRMNKHLFYFYDHTAVAKRNGRSSFCKEIEQRFIQNGWTIQLIHMGQAPLQDLKYRRIQSILNNTEQFPYQVQIHEERCSVMLLSMDQTGTKETEKGTKKDKSKEVDMTFPQEQATHFSDCFDMAVWAVCEKNLYPLYQYMVPGVHFGS
jgi:hypothetical protein